MLQKFETLARNSNLGSVSNLSQSSPRSLVEDNKSHDNDWNVGCKRHYPSNCLSPGWVRSVTILYGLIARKAEYQNGLNHTNTTTENWRLCCNYSLTSNLVMKFKRPAGHVWSLTDVTAEC